MRQRQLLPVGHEVGMHAVASSNLVDGLLSFDRLQSNLRFEFGTVAYSAESGHPFRKMATWSVLAIVAGV